LGIPRTVPRLVVVLALVFAGAARAQNPVSELNGYVTLSSGYWKHGLSQTDGASLQLGIDYQNHTGFFAYARAMNVDYPQNFGWRTRDVEASAYVGYHDRREMWSWTASVGRYFYPGTDELYDYDEVSVSVGLRDRVFYTASYSSDYALRPGSALNQEVSLALAEGGPQITHWNVGASKLIGRVAVDLRYYDGNYGWRNYLGDPSAEHLVLSMSYALRRKGSSN
jgi:uncharacterized protein (TIGR02001 family)